MCASVRGHGRHGARQTDRPNKAATARPGGGQRPLAPNGVAQCHQRNACGAQRLVGNNEVERQARFEDARVIWKLVAHRPHRRGKDVAHKQRQHKLLQGQPAGGHHCARRRVARGGFRRHVEDDDAHGLRRQPRKKRHMVRHVVFHHVEHAPTLEEKDAT